MLPRSGRTRNVRSSMKMVVLMAAVFALGVTVEAQRARASGTATLVHMPAADADPPVVERTEDFDVARHMVEREVCLDNSDTHDPRRKRAVSSPSLPIQGRFSCTGGRSALCTGCGWATVGPRARIRPYAWPRRSTGSMAAAAWSSSPIGSAGPMRPFGSGPHGCAPSSSRATSTPPAPVLRWRLDEHRCRNFYDKYSKTIGWPAASARLTMERATQWLRTGVLKPTPEPFRRSHVLRLTAYAAKVTPSTASCFAEATGAVVDRASQRIVRPRAWPLSLAACRGAVGTAARRGSARHLTRPALGYRRGPRSPSAGDNGAGVLTDGPPPEPAAPGSGGSSRFGEGGAPPPVSPSSRSPSRSRQTSVIFPACSMAISHMSMC